MKIIIDEMKSTAEYAIKVAKERFNQELDFSEQSIARLEDILGQLYWGFINRSKVEGEDGVIFNTATIWGSYLGEYMRLKMGGTWILKGSDPLVFIKNTEFSPIKLVYEKITNHPEYSLQSYINKTMQTINAVVINPQQPRPKPETIETKKQISDIQPKKSVIDLREFKNQVSDVQPKKFVTIDKRLIFILAGIAGVLLITLASILGYKVLKSGGLSAYGLSASATNSGTNISTEKTIITPTANATDTSTPTVTLLPTYTPQPTATEIPSQTPLPTETQTETLTPTETQTPFVPTRTRAPTKSPTLEDTHIPATEVPPATITPRPPPTEPPPVVLQSCEINPSAVQAGINTPITFIANFSGPGQGFTASIQANFPGQSDCSGSDTSGGGVASCDGSSGLLPSSIKVDVIFTSSVGDCTASFSSQ